MVNHMIKSKILRVGFWLDWNGDTELEMESHIGYLETEIFDFQVTIKPVVIKNYKQIQICRCDLLTLDYGGISFGYNETTVVPIIVDRVNRWCISNPDRYAMVWCSFPPEHYRTDFMVHNQGVPDNLLFFNHWHTLRAIRPILVGKYHV